MLKLIGRLVGLSALAAIVGLSAAPALAVPVTIEFAGNWHSDVSNGPLANQAFSGTFRLDSGLSDSTADPNIGTYTTGAGFGATLTTGGYTLSIVSPTQTVVQNFGSVDFWQALTTQGDDATVAGVSGVDIIAQLFLGLTDLGSPPDLVTGQGWTIPNLGDAMFSEVRLTLSYVAGVVSGNYNLVGSLTSFQVAAVPLPAGVLLFGSGLGLLGLLGFRRKRPAVPAIA